MASLRLAHGKRLALDRPLVMAILNATPDSFSDGGALARDVDAAVRRTVDEGADILDVGGESTRPGHQPVAAEEELRRVLPALAACRRIAPDLPVSIDTRKAAVARAALDAGAALVNDVSGAADAAMLDVVRSAKAGIVLMRDQPLHTPEGLPAHSTAEVLAACRAQLADLTAKARAAGLPDDAIVLDPGVGFGDPPGGDVVANLALVRGARHVAPGFPVLVGASRKRFIGTMTGEAVAERRVGGSVAAAVLAVQAGARIVRVHDVAPTVQALRVLQASRAPEPARSAQS